MRRKNVVLVTGLPGSGKSKFSELLYQRLRNEGCIRLDGAEIRAELFPQLNESPDDYDVLCRSVAFMARMFLRHGADRHCIVELTCPDSRSVNSFKAPIRNTVHALTHVWMDTLDKEDCKYQDVAALWTPPTSMHFQVLGHHFPEEMKEAVTVVVQHLHESNRGPYPVML